MHAFPYISSTRRFNNTALVGWIFPNSLDIRTLTVLNLLVYVGCIISILCAIAPHSVLAHSEAEKARFVWANGSDEGPCNNRFRPCATIDYAVTQANKGDKILVAQGNYKVRSSESLIYLISDIQPVFGGYNVSDNYQNQSPDQFITTITGVPSEYASAVYARGFHVISDTKTVNTSKVTRGLASISLMKNTQALSECSNGTASGFDCMQMSLLGRVPLSSLPTSSGAANDIWGHVDLNDMREYAIVGLQRGIAVVDVTEPEIPVVVGSVSGESTTWRDIKVLQYYDQNTRRFKSFAYAGADNVSEGLTIIDLSQLPNNISVVDRSTVDRLSHNIYISNVNYSTNTALANRQALLHVAGSQNFGGAWRTFTLNDPSTPSAAYRPNTSSRSEYTHDASSLLIDDARVSSACNLPNAETCNVILDFNENEVSIWQHNQADSASKLSEFTYPNLAYVHSGWSSEDKRYVFVHDELDERNFSLNTTLNIFDISSLQNPLLVGTWTGPTRASDHNGFVKGNKYYMANYERGVTVLDISDATSPVEIGYFDTFGASDNASFNGVWGVYPFLPSGNIVASDIQGGLYILRDDTLSTQSDAVGFKESLMTVNEGEILSLEVQKQGQGDLSVDYEILYPSSSQDDLSVTSGTLAWSANQTASQFIELAINTDEIDEFDELAVVVLNNPKNGDIINSRSLAFITIAGSAVNRGQLSFENAQVDVLETQGSAVFTINRVNGSTEALSAVVNIISNTASANEDFSFTAQDAQFFLNWEDGDTTSKNIEITITNDELTESTETFSLQISTEDPLVLTGISSIDVRIKDDESNLPPVVNAGNNLQVNSRQNVVLNGASFSDEEPSTASLSWTQVSGSQVTLLNSNTLSPSFSAPQSNGIITLALSVTDEFGATAVDQIELTVVMPVSPENGNTQGSGGTVSIVYAFFLFIIWGLRAIIERSAVIKKRKIHN